MPAMRLCLYAILWATVLVSSTRGSETFPLGGRVMDKTGAAQPGVSVRVIAPPGYIETLPDGLATSTTADGEYHLQIPWRFERAVVVAAVLPSGMEVYGIYSAGDDPTNLMLAEPADTGWVEAHLKTTRGAAPTRGYLELLQMTSRMPIQRVKLDEHFTGTHRFGPVPPGTYAVRYLSWAEHEPTIERFGPPRPRPTMGKPAGRRLKANQTVEFEVEVPDIEGSDLLIEVVDAQGRPVSDYEARMVVRRGQQVSRQMLCPAVNRADGRLLIPGVPATEIGISIASEAGYALADYTVDPSTSDTVHLIRIPLTNKQGRLRGKVAFDDGATSGLQALVVGQAHSPKLNLLLNWVKEVPCDAAGAFELKQLPAGEYDVTGQALGANVPPRMCLDGELFPTPPGMSDGVSKVRVDPKASAHVVVQDDETTHTEVSLVVDHKKMIEVNGQVVNEQNQPVADARLRLRFENMEMGIRAPIETETNTEGRWSARVPELTMAKAGATMPAVRGSIIHHAYGRCQIEAGTIVKFLEGPTVLHPKQSIKVQVLPTSGTMSTEALQRHLAETLYLVVLTQGGGMAAVDEQGHGIIQDVPRNTALYPGLYPDPMGDVRVKPVHQWYVDGQRLDGARYKLPLTGNPQVELRIPLGLPAGTVIPGPLPVRLLARDALTGNPLAGTQIRPDAGGGWGSGTLPTNAAGELDLALEPRNGTYGITINGPAVLVKASHGKHDTDSSNCMLILDAKELRELAKDGAARVTLDIAQRVGDGSCSVGFRDSMEHEVLRGFRLVDDDFTWVIPAKHRHITVFQMSTGWRRFHVENDAGKRQRFHLRHGDQEKPQFRTMQTPEGSVLEINSQGTRIAQVIELVLDDHLEMPEEKTQ